MDIIIRGSNSWMCDEKSDNKSRLQKLNIKIQMNRPTLAASFFQEDLDNS